MKATIKNEIRFEDLSHIVACRLKKMRVHPLGHQYSDLHPFAADIPSEIADHSRRAHHVDLAPRYSANP